MSGEIAKAKIPEYHGVFETYAKVEILLLEGLDNYSETWTWMRRLVGFCD